MTLILLILKYLSWLLAVGVGFVGSWLYKFTVMDEESHRKGLTRAGKWGAVLAFVGLVSALSWTVLDDLARQQEKAELDEFRSTFENMQAELQVSQGAVQRNQADLLQKQEELNHAMDVIAFQLRPEGGDVTEDERSKYRRSLNTITGLLTIRHEELLSVLAELPPSQVPGAVQQVPPATVDFLVSNSLACLQLLQRNSEDESGRRTLVWLAEEELAVVISVRGDGSLNFRPMSQEWDLSAGFELEFDSGRNFRVSRDRCENSSGGGCDVSVDMSAPEAWETELIAELASAEISHIRSLGDPARLALVEPGAASTVQQAFQCVVRGNR